MADHWSCTCTVTKAAILPADAAAAAAKHPAVAAWSAALLYRLLTAIQVTNLLLQASVPSGGSRTPCKLASDNLAVPAAYLTIPILSPETRVGPLGAWIVLRHSIALRHAHASDAPEDSPTGKQ